MYLLAALKTLLEKVTDEDRRKYSPEMQVT